MNYLHAPRSAGVLALALSLSGGSLTAARGATPPPVLTTGVVGSAGTAIYANPLTVNAPPLNGFTPQVVFGLTDQQDRNSADFAAIPSSSPGGSSLPKGAAAKYLIATFDTGSQSHIINNDAQAVFNFSQSGRVGNYSADIIGVSGTESADVSDPLGVYMTGFPNATSNGTALSVTPGTLKGQWSTSILTTQQGSTLPNLIGSPMAAQYQTVIKNSQTTHLTLNGTTYKSPAVSFQALNTAPPDSSYVRLTLDLQSPSGLSPNPVFVPSLDNFNNFVDNPTTPTFWAGFFAKVSGVGPVSSISNESFLFDTGAEVTVLSQDTAAAMGFYSAGPDISTPDFFVPVTGVGGATQQVPGFYVPQLSVLTNGGPLTWTHVPVLVLDIIDPRDGVGFVPGILGTNLFADRDLILNGGMTNPAVYLSPRIAAQWTNPAGGSFTTDGNWSLGTPDAADLPANFLGAITADRTITLSAPTTVGSLTFDNLHRYTLTGPGPLRLETNLASPSISVLSGSHTIDVPLVFAAPGTLTISPGAQLDIATQTLSLITPAATIRQYLLDDSLTSLTPDPTDTHSVGYLDQNGALTVRLLITGDANGDGLLNADDFALVDRGQAGGGSFWWQGDFNYDGLVNAQDYLLLDATFAKQQGGPPDPALLASRESEFGAAYVAELIAAVPEPTALSVTILASVSIRPSRSGKRAPRAGRTSR